MLVALSVLDLPFKAAEHKTVFKGTQMTLTAGSPMIVYHEEIQPAAKVAEHAPILVSENFFRSGDRFREVNGEQVDKFVTEQFLVDTVYGCHIVVTNPDVVEEEGRSAAANSERRAAGGQRPIHAQHPPGPRPVSHANARLRFYFPLAGKFAHYPVQVASNDEVLAFAAPFMFNVVKELTNIDKQSWDYISQYGSEDDVLTFLKTENILRVNLDRIAWRMHDKAFFEKVIELLSNAARVQHHALVVRREARRRAGHPPVLAVLRRLREPVRRLAGQSAADDRSGRAACLRADGLSPAGERPRGPTGPQARDPQRPLL